MSWLIPLPWSWATDPLWLMVGNVLFWPCYAAYVVGRDRWEVRQRRKKVAASR